MKYIWPVQPNISQGFGENPDYYRQYGQQGHDGIDLAVPSGTPVKASADGSVNFEGSGINNGLMGSPAGICVIIDHGDVMTGYAHMSNTIVDKGQQVKQGDVIGYSGSTGAATGPHVHFEFIGKPANTTNGYYGRLNPDQFNVGVEDVAPAPPLNSYQRIAMDGTRYRLGPSRDAAVHPKFPDGLKDGDTYDFKGYVHGENVSGNDIWFVGAYSGGYSWSGGFYDSSVEGLPDLTSTTIPPVVDPPVTTPTVTYPDSTTDPLVTKVYNKKHPIAADYVPADLVDAGNGVQLRREASTAFHLMQAAAGNLLLLAPASGYRSFEKQKQVYESYVAQHGQAEADTFSARPGYSEHQSGLAVDLDPIDTVFSNKSEYTWLKDNAHNFGFVERYPFGKSDVTGYTWEPWHWRYVGVDAATAMWYNHNGNTTLEESYDIEGGDYKTPGIPVDPTEPSNPGTTPAPGGEETEVPTPPVTPPEATWSATKFGLRLTTQIAVTAGFVQGIAAVIYANTGALIEQAFLGWVTIVVSFAVIFLGQLAFKLDQVVIDEHTDPFTRRLVNLFKKFKWFF